MEIARSMRTFDLAPGAKTPEAGIYVVVHSNPFHTPAHEVVFSVPSILPTCNACAGARFSFKCQLPISAGEHEFFKASPDGIGCGFPTPAVKFSLRNNTDRVQ
jgi:hypothetical protein